MQRLRYVIVLAMLSLLSAVPLLAQNATFTYQGVLRDNGLPANGAYDLTFTLWDDPAGGTQIGDIVSLPGVAVQEGLFTVALNGADEFGPNAFSGARRWIEIGVSGVTLAPRQEASASPYAAFARAPWISDGLGGLSYSGGNVGIGTNAPAQTLSVQGTIESVAGGFQFPDGSVQTTAATGGNGFWSPNGADVFNNNTGNVGVGTDTPHHRLRVSGGPAWTANFWSGSLELDTAGAIAWGSNPGGQCFGIGPSGGGLYFFRSASGPGTTDSPALYDMIISDTGDIGVGDIGFTPPAAPLDIFSAGEGAPLLRFSTERPWFFHQVRTGPSAGLQLQSTSGLKAFEITALNGTNIATFFADDANPRVGIGTIAPTATLTVAGPASNDTAIRAEAAGFNGNGVIGEANAGSNAFGVWGRSTAGIGGYFSGGTFALVAAGRAKVNVLEVAGGSDLAEPFNIRGDDGAIVAPGKIAPGLVVVIDPRNPGELRVSTEAYDQKVAGVISGANNLPTGMLMKAEGELHADGDHPVALTGRVWVYCDARGAAIEPGDLLTTSDVPGHAMKSVDRQRSPGAVLGKAMTALPHGAQGLVLALVNLQ